MTGAPWCVDTASTPGASASRSREGFIEARWALAFVGALLVSTSAGHLGAQPVVATSAVVVVLVLCCVRTPLASAAAMAVMCWSVLTGFAINALGTLTLTVSDQRRFLALLLVGLVAAGGSRRPRRDLACRASKPAGPRCVRWPQAGKGITAEEAFVARVLDEVEGYPFLVQLWGAELWEAAPGRRDSRLHYRPAGRHRDRHQRAAEGESCAGRVETLTPSEQDLLISTASCSYPPLRTSELRNRSRKSEGHVNVLMGRLTEQGVLYRVQKDVHEYTAPKFHQYLQRRVATLGR